MAKHTVTLIPGDGIGLETTAAMRRVVEACGVDIEWEIAEAGAHMMDSCGTPLPEATIEAVRRNKVAIKGPITTPVGTGFRYTVPCPSGPVGQGEGILPKRGGRRITLV